MRKTQFNEPLPEAEKVVASRVEEARKKIEESWTAFCV